MTRTAAKPRAAPATPHIHRCPCGKPATVGKLCAACYREAVDRLIAAAEAAGTHGPISKWRVVCPRCRRWVPGLWDKDSCYLCAGGSALLDKARAALPPEVLTTAAVGTYLKLLVQGMAEPFWVRVTGIDPDGCRRLEWVKDEATLARLAAASKAKE